MRLFQVNGKSEKNHEWAVILSIAGVCCFHRHEPTAIRRGKPLYSIKKQLTSLLILQTFRHFSLNILLNFNSFFTQILFNYISCYYANNVTMKSFAAAEIAYDMEWYKLPVQNRLFVQRMIQRAQKPFYLKGYDIVDCSLSTFLNVSLIRSQTLWSDDDFCSILQFFRTAVSYFLIFKRVGN